MRTNTDTPRVYVACLASYNNGILFGEWIDVPEDADTLREAISAMLARSPEPNAEEWAIHDTDGISVDGENPDLDKLCECARLLALHGDAWTAYVDTVGSHYANESDFEDSYCGEYDSAEDYAAEVLSECGDIPAHLANYIDYEAYARDLGYEGYSFPSSPRGVYVFLPV